MATIDPTQPVAAQPTTDSTNIPYLAANPQNLPQYNTDEILWYDNGIWGDSGYAMWNPMGKTLTSNLDIYMMHSLMGKVMFDLMHRRDDVGFTTPPSKQWLYDLHQMLVVTRKRLADLTRLPNDSNGLDVVHAQPAPQMFLVYPVPFFGQRVRQADCLKYCTTGLLLLSEMVQHADNDRIGYVTPSFSGIIGKYVQEILAQMGMKFFGYDRAAAYAPTFVVKDTDFTAYDPSKLMISTELIDERPPQQAWPTTNDLARIEGLPIAQAILFGKRWPLTSNLYFGDPSAFPGIGQSGQNANTNPNSTADGQTNGGSGSPPAMTASSVSGAFVAPPGQAP